MIRRASTRDLSSLVRLWTALTQHHARADSLYALHPGSAAEIERLLKASLRDRDAASWLAFAGAEAVGLCSARIDVAPPIHYEIERAEITDLFVAPEQRRRGLAKALVETALAWVAQRQVARVEVRVASLNPEGQAFWRSQGFGDFVDVLQRRL